ncbi:16S rRNA (cytosine(1402)-N(4))-methyltransferase RsmH [Candidatus Margulisiibacteriota bacterium]
MGQARAGFLFDLGVSSYQIDEAARGFSIKKDGPLDMRMDKSQKLTASDILNRSSQEELEKIFKEYGEERFSRRIAKAVEQQRPLTTTKQLKEIVEQAIPTWKKRESVTRIFQALRIAVNQELDSLKLALSDAIELLRPGGRIVVISYHSLEDRIVKQTFRQAEQLKVLTKKPLRANEAEISSNPRARSAKLRAGEKL